MSGGGCVDRSIDRRERKEEGEWLVGYQAVTNRRRELGAPSMRMRLSRQHKTQSTSKAKIYSRILFIPISRLRCVFLSEESLQHAFPNHPLGPP